MSTPATPLTSATSGCASIPRPRPGAFCAGPSPVPPDEAITDVDGLVTDHGDPPTLPGLAPAHLLGAEVIDHLVVTTPDLDRTVGAIERGLGLQLRRTREGEAYGQKVRQAFFRMGEVVLEVVGATGVRQRDRPGSGAWRSRWFPCKTRSTSSVPTW